MSERSVTESLHSATATRASPDPVAAKGGTGASRAGLRRAPDPPRPAGPSTGTDLRATSGRPGPGPRRGAPTEPAGPPSSLNSPRITSC